MLRCVQLTITLPTISTACLLYPMTWTSLHGQSFSSPFNLEFRQSKMFNGITQIQLLYTACFDCNIVNLDVWEWLGIWLWRQSVQFQLPFVIVAKVINWIGHIDNVKYLLWYGLWDDVVKFELHLPWSLVFFDWISSGPGHKQFPSG